MSNNTIIGIIIGILLSVALILVTVILSGGLKAAETREQILARVSSGNYSQIVVDVPDGRMTIFTDASAGVKCYSKSASTQSCVKVK